MNIKEQEIVEKYIAEATTSDYSRLSTTELKDMLSIFSNVGRSTAKPVITAIKREMSRRLGEDYELEEAKVVPFKKLEQAWTRTNGDKDKQAKLIKKHDLKKIISTVRPGEIKLGVKNKLVGTTKAATAAGLDLDDELIFITNNPLKIIYPKKSTRRPEGEEIKEAAKVKKDLDTLRLEKIVSLTLKHDNMEVVEKFVASSNINLDSTAAEIKEAYEIFEANATVQSVLKALRLKGGKDADALIKKMRDLGLESKVTKAHADAAKKILKGQITKFVKESEPLEEAIKWWTVTITKKAGKLFKGQTVDVKASNSAEAIKKGIKQMKGNPMTVPSASVDAVLGESRDMDFEKTNVLTYDEYDEVKNFRNFNKKDWKRNAIQKKYVRIKPIKEATDLEEAALPFKELEKAWIRTKGNDKKREKLVKKHNLKPLISNVRQGAIKLGPMNNLKMKDGNHTMAGLDAEGELIFISNNPTRIHYPSNTKSRPKGDEMKEYTMVHQRLVRVVEVALGERPENTNEFIKESNIDLTMTPSVIQKAYKQFNIKK